MRNAIENLPRHALLLAMFTCLGCNQSATPEPTASQALSPTGSVAVIDLDRVAQQLGQDERITQTLTATQSARQQQLTKLAQSYQQQIKAKQLALEESPPSEASIQLASFQRQANTKLNEARQQLNRDLANQKSQLISQFREAIKPYARKVAGERGLGVIVTNNDRVIFDYTSSVDITEDVVRTVQQRQQP